MKEQNKWSFIFDAKQKNSDIENVSGVSPLTFFWCHPRTLKYNEKWNSWGPEYCQILDLILNFSNSFTPFKIVNAISKFPLKWGNGTGKTLKRDTMAKWTHCVINCVSKTNKIWFLVRAVALTFKQGGLKMSFWNQRVKKTTSKFWVLIAM